MKTISKLWRQSKLKTKLLWIYCLLILVFMVSLTALAFSVFSNNLRTKIMYSAEHGISQTRDFMNYKFSQLLDGLSQIANDSRIREITSNSSRQEIKQEYWDMLEIKERLTSYQSREEIQRVRLYVDGDHMYSADKINLFSVEEVSSQKWLQELQNSTADVGAFSSEELEDTSSQPVLAFVQKIKSIVDYQKVTGYVRVDFGKKNIQEMLLEADPTPDSVTCLINSSGQVIASSKELEYPMVKPDFEAAVEAYLNDTYEMKEVEAEGQKYLISENYLYHSGWVMVTVIPYRGVMQEVYSSQKKYILMALVALILVGILIYVIANSVTSRVEKLAAHMQKVQQGNLEVIQEDAGEDEIGSLYRAFNEMVRGTRNLMDEKYELGKQAKTAELKALQSQINPHFLYNTLDMIKWFSYSGRNEDIDKVVTELARFYKLTLNRGKEIVTVEDEIVHSKAYVSIQNYRFEGTIELVTDFSEEVLTRSIPKITLQPLIENSILHGILEKTDEGIIRITGECKGDETILYLEDDGIGMEPEQVQKILTGHGSSVRGSGFGIYNIHKRLKILYGEKAGLVYHTEPGKGTMVEIHLGKEVL